MCITAPVYRRVTKKTVMQVFLRTAYIDGGHIRSFVGLVWFRGLTPQQQPGSYQGGEMMMKSVFWWRKPEHPEETTDLRQVTDETFSHIRPLPSPGIELGPQRCEAFVGDYTIILNVYFQKIALFRW